MPLEYRGKRLFLQFDGAAHFAEVYLNGEKLAEHACGYTAFRVEITSAVRYGMENRLAVRLDTTENPAVPPFGFVLDYLAYGGLYREVWLDVPRRGRDRGRVRYNADAYARRDRPYRIRQRRPPARHAARRCGRGLQP